MTTETLAVIDWRKVDSESYGFNNGKPTYWNTFWDVTVPPLPPLDENEPYAVAIYIMELVAAIAQLETDDIEASFNIRPRDSQVVAEGEIRVKLPEQYQIKGLQEWEIRQIANDENLEKPTVERLMGYKLKN